MMRDLIGAGPPGFTNMASDQTNDVAAANKATPAKFTEIWDTNWYLNFAFKNPDTPMNRYQLRNFHEFYTKVVPSDFSNLRILEYGGGPCIFTFISASPRAKEIVSADYTPSNLEAVELWQKKDPEGFNWKPFFEYVVKKLEGKGDEEVTQREEGLRDKVTLVQCDLRADNILALPDELACHGPPYDVIASCFTVEIVVETEAEYITAVKKLSKMLSPGGYLILNGWTVRMSHEAVKEELPPGVVDWEELDDAFGLGAVSPEFVRDCMVKAGLEVVQSEMSGPEDADESGGPERYHFVIGRVPK